MNRDWGKLVAQIAEGKNKRGVAAQNVPTGSNSPCERVLSRGSINVPIYQLPRHRPYTGPTGPDARKKAFRAAFDFMERHALSTSAPVPCSLDYWDRVHQYMVQVSREWQGNSFAEDLFVAVFCELEREYTEASQPEEQNG